jgi:hypothetical protein
MVRRDTKTFFVFTDVCYSSTVHIKGDMLVRKSGDCGVDTNHLNVLFS